MTLELIVGLSALVIGIAALCVAVSALIKSKENTDEINYHQHSRYKLRNCSAVETWKKAGRMRKTSAEE